MSKLGVLLAALAMVGATASAKDYPVTERTGKAIQAAIDAAAEAGGGRVVVPAGTYPSGTLYLKSHVELHLEKGAVVQGGTNGADYATFPSKIAKLGRSLLQAWDAEDIAITGEGAFDCQGLAFFDTTKRRFERFYLPRGGRPEMVLFHRCRNVRFRDVSFLNSPSWTMRLRFCENLDFERIMVLNDLMFINADGIDFDGCRHVRLVDSDFLTGDDSIIMRAIREKGSNEKVVMEDARIENCRLNSACQCVRIGCPADDTIRDIHFRNITMKGYNGINFDYPTVYLSPTNEGLVDVHDVTFENVTGELSGRAMRIACAAGVKIRGVRDVLFRNFDVKSAGPLLFQGNVWSAIERIRRENFTLNGERLPDGEFAADCTSDRPLRRTQPGEYNYKPPQPYVPPKFVTVAGKDGAAIQAAIDEIAANETGGRVLVPAGEYPTDSLRMRSNVELRLEKGASVIRRKVSEGSLTPGKAAKALIYAWDEHDLAITGEGTIDGYGLSVVGKSPRERTPLVQFVRCRGIRLDGVIFLNPPNQTMLVRSCEDVAMDGLRIGNDRRMNDAGGIDFDGCRRVRIANSDVRTGDDRIALRANDDVVFRNVTVNGKRLEDGPVGEAVEAGFVPLFNGKDLSGWEGATNTYCVSREGYLTCVQNDGKGESGDCNLWTAREYTNFVVRFEVKLPPNANNGLGIRTRAGGWCSREGIEIQLLDDWGDQYRTLKPEQYTGSIYGVVAPKRKPNGESYLKQPGEWNSVEVAACGTRIRVTLNGEVIVEDDVAKYPTDASRDGVARPGLHNLSGRLHWCGHGHNIFWRNIRIREIPTSGDLP